MKLTMYIITQKSKLITIKNIFKFSELDTKRKVVMFLLQNSSQFFTIF